MTGTTRHTTLSYARKILRHALDTGDADRIGLNREFIVALPPSGPMIWRTRSPFTDEVARALADPANLACLETGFDPSTAGSATSGRRSSRPAAGAERSSRCGWIAPAATTDCRCCGTTRPRSATTTRRSASPSTSTSGSATAAKNAGPIRTSTAARRRRRTPRLALFPSRPNAPAPAIRYGPSTRFRALVDQLDLGQRPRRPPGPPHPGHQLLAHGAGPAPHPPLPRATSRSA